MTSQTFNLELIPQGVPPIVHVSQYDKGQTWLIDVTENGIPFTIPSGTSVAIQGTKPDNTGFQYAGTYSGTQVEFTVEQQMTVLAGELDCELVLVNGEEQVATINFILAVEPAALDDETIISETELPLIEQAAELGAVINAYATQIHADATTAENAATSATASQTAAAASEATATQAADDALASQTAAASSASNAATSETNAAASETAAASSATSAAASAAAAQAAVATDMTGATANTDGAHGLVPQPLAGDETKFLRGDGTWGDTVPTNHAAGAKTYGGGTSSNYGHVKLSDNYTSSDGAASDSVGASSKAVNDSYTSLYDDIHTTGWTQVGSYTYTPSAAGQAYINHTIATTPNNAKRAAVSVCLEGDVECFAEIFKGHSTNVREFAQAEYLCSWSGDNINVSYARFPSTNKATIKAFYQ